MAAPLLELRGRNPGFLVAHRTDPGEVGLLVAGLLLLFPSAAGLGAVAASTVLSLPAILTGTFPGPDSLAVAADHPRNLFSMLSGSCDIHVHESRTFLFEEDRTDAKPPAGGMVELARDLAILSVHVLLPKISGGLPVVPTFPQRGGDFGFSAMLPETDGGTDPERLELFSVRGAAARPQLLRAPASFRDVAETRADDETP